MPTELREKIAKIQHEQWSGWMEYLFSKCERLEDGGVKIPVEFVSRWERQCNTPYNELSDKEQESDKRQAEKILAIIQAEKHLHRDVDVTEQVIEFIREWIGKHRSIPYDVSAWKNTGIERGYDKYFGIKWE